MGIWNCLLLTVNSPHHCVGFLFFAWIPPGHLRLLLRLLLTHSLTPLTHSFTHSLTLTHSLTHSLNHTHTLTHSLSLTVTLTLAHSLTPSRGRCRRSTESFLAAFRVADTVHRASWRSCGARGRRWAAAGSAWQAQSWLPFAWQAQYTERPGGVCGARGRRWAAAGFVAGAVHRASWRSCGARGRRWAAAGFAWQAQYTERPGGAAARVGAAGPRLASRGRRSTQSFLAAFRVAGAVHRASWWSCGARGRRWAAARFAWQAQYRELPGCLSRGRRSTQSVLAELRCAWAPLGRGWLRVAGAVQTASWLPFAWQAQYSQRPGGAAARVGAAGPRLASRGRRSTDSFLAAFRVAGAVLTASWRSCGARGRRWAADGFAWQAQYRERPGCLSRGRRSTQSVLAELLSWRSCRHILWFVYPLSQSPHLTQLISLPRSLCFSLSLSHFHHNLSHPNSSQFHFSHLTYHIRTHHSSTSHTWHHKSTSHTSLLTPPWSSH